MKRTSRELRLGIRALLGLLLIFLISGERATNLVGQAADTSTWRAISSPFATEDEVLEFLRTARVVSKKRIRKGLNQPFRVRLDKDGVEATAVFRDVDVIVAKAEMNGTLRTNYRDDALFEVAAYELNRMLGLKLVPPTVFRKVDGQKGSLQIFIDGAMTEGDRVDRKLTSPRPREWALLRQIRWIFDALIHNDDRNLGNSLIDKDWNLWLIDHTRCFYPLARLPKKDNLTHIEAKLWERLKETEQDEVRGRLKSTLEKPEIDALLKRWTLLVEHYATQIEERGERRVLFTLPM